MSPDELSLVISEKPEGCLLKCWIQPRSSRNAVIGIHGDALKIALTAPPVDGKANKELLKFLAKYFKLPKGGIQIATGGEFPQQIDPDKQLKQKCHNRKTLSKIR